MKEKIVALQKMADDSLKVADQLLGDGHYGFAAARAYYALFYVSEALLATKNLSFSRHGAVIAAIGTEFVKQGTLPKSYHQTLHESFDTRTIGDYWVEGKEVSKEQSQETIEAVKKEIKVGLELLKKLS